jgi:hypothetical protein
MRIAVTGMIVLIAWLAPCSLVEAQQYPVSGRWTYGDLSGDGPSKECPPPRMEFRGARRFDGGGSVPDYRNVSVAPIGRGQYRLADEFFTGQIRGRVNYTLHQLGNDRIELRLEQGPVIKLRRCA